MPPKTLCPGMATLESQLVQTMRAGHEAPKSLSDWQFCARAVIRMFHIERRPLAIDLEYATTKEPQ